MEVEFSNKANEDLEYWKKSGNKKIQNKIQELILCIKKNPFSGIGKPEKLKYNLSGLWSRRIDAENRIVYLVDEDKNLVIILQCKYHY